LWKTISYGMDVVGDGFCGKGEGGKGGHGTTPS